MIHEMRKEQNGDDLHGSSQEGGKERIPAVSALLPAGLGYGHLWHALKQRMR